MENTLQAEEQKAQDRRRSSRVFVPVPLLVSGQGADGKPFQEETHTLRVNANGGLMAMVTPVTPGQTLTVTNRTSQQQHTCRIVYVGPEKSHKIEVGIEFTKPAPDFWGPAGE